MDGQATEKKRKKRVVPAVWRLRRRERPYRERGIRFLAGVDEAGVGPLAGPVVAAAVIMPEDCVIRGVDDSKKIHGRERRQELARQIAAEAVSAAIGVSRPREIDRVNVYWATLNAMARAIRRLTVRPELILVDARTVPGVEEPQEAHVGGDADFFQIACASVLAKTYRDRLMERLDRRYPGYGFAQNLGYPTPDHRKAIRSKGPCWIHRRHFRGVADWCQEDLDSLWGDRVPEGKRDDG